MSALDWVLCIGAWTVLAGFCVLLNAAGKAQVKK